MRGGVMHGRKSHRPWKLVQNPPTHTQTHDRIQGGRHLARVGGWELKPTQPAVRGSGEFLAPFNYTVGGHTPQKEGVVPSGSLLDQAHLLPSLGRGLCPEGEPRNNREVFCGQTSSRTTPSNQRRRERWESRVSWPELQLLRLGRRRPLTFSRLPSLCLEAAEEPALPL